MSLDLKNVHFRKIGGHAVYAEGHDVHVDQVVFDQVGGDAVHMVSHQALLIRRLGLPDGISPDQLAGLLAALSTLPEHSREAAVRKSGLFQRAIAAGANAANLCNRLLELAYNPALHDIIRVLMGG